MRRLRAQIYRDRKGEYRFRFIHANGKIAGDGYKRRAGAIRQLKRLVGLLRSESLTIVDTANTVIDWGGVS